jgi:hypothetical protein
MTKGLVRYRRVGGPHPPLPKNLGAPGLDFETWESMNPDRLLLPQRIFEYRMIG